MAGMFQIINGWEKVKMFFQKKFLLALLLLAAFIGIYGNRGSSIEMAGMEINSYYKWGKEYILAKDLLPFGFEAALEENTLLLDCTTQKPRAVGGNNFPAINPDKGLAIKLNGLEIDYKIIHGDIAFGIDVLCNLEYDPLDDVSHREEYYAAFRQFGYSPYYFKKNSSDSISILPLEKRITCNMGEISFTGISNSATKSEMEGYFDLETILRKMNAEYCFQNNILDIYEDDFQRLEFSVPEQVTNDTSLGYPVLATEVMATGMEKIPAYIERGRLKINLAKFSDAYGYHYSEEDSNHSGRIIIVEKGVAK